MTFVAEIDGTVDPIDQKFAVTVEKIGNVERSLLEMFVRQQSVEHFADLPVYYIVFSKLSTMKFTPQGSDMIDDLPTTFCKTLGKSYIELRQLLIEPVKLFVDLFLNLAKCFRRFPVEMLLNYPRQKFIDPGKEILYRKVIFLEYPLLFWF